MIEPRQTEQPKMKNCSSALAQPNIINGDRFLLQSMKPIHSWSFRVKLCGLNFLQHNWLLGNLRRLDHIRSTLDGQQCSKESSMSSINHHNHQHPTVTHHTQTFVLCRHRFFVLNRVDHSIGSRNSIFASQLRGMYHCCTIYLTKE